MNAADPSSVGLTAYSQAADPLIERYRATRARTAARVAPLSAEDCALQSMPDASPAKWHLAHTTWFFETFVAAPQLPAYRSPDPRYRVLFNSYYQSVGERRPRSERGMLSRPDLAAVLDYRAHVDRAMEQCCALAAADPALARMIELGINHEEQHQELILSDILHLLSRNPGRPTYDPAGPRPVASPGGTLLWISHSAGIARIGDAGAGFAFDNEGPAHRVYVEAFEIAKRPVTNGDYRAFIDDGGYRRPELWLALGWEAVCAGDWAAPLYWERRDAGWESFTLRGMAELDLALPVLHLSYFEADAYARWAQARLPTEFEWEAVMRGAGAGNSGPTGAANDLGRGSAWEWTSSAYAAYPGFRPAAGAVGEYNGKFMCNQYVLRGGSFATPPGHARISYRNFFPPDARWQFTGLRLARDCRGA